MSNYCTIKQIPRAQTLKEMSGLSQDLTYSYISYFNNIHGRLPELDEIPNANSEKHLRERLKITKDGYTTLKKLQDIYGEQESIKDYNVLINQDHSDLEVKLIPIGENISVTIKHRPSSFFEEDPKSFIKTIDYDHVDNGYIIREALDRMQDCYGIETKMITTAEISEIPELRNLSVSNVKAFIYNNTIYVNTDLASVEDPIHEQLHLFLGTLRYNNPTLYFQLVNSVESFPNFEDQLRFYPNRAISDIKEEIFVEQLSKYLTNQSNYLQQVDSNIMHYIKYNIIRDINSFVQGQISVNPKNLFAKSLLELGEETGSDAFEFKSLSRLHRLVANTKEDLIKNGELMQDCV